MALIVFVDKPKHVSYNVTVYNTEDGKLVNMWPKHSNRRRQVQELLSNTIRTLCKNTLAASGDVTVEGLLGITVNNSEVILVNINELVQGKSQIPDSSAIEEEDGITAASYDNLMFPLESIAPRQQILNRKRSCDESHDQAHDTFNITSSGLKSNPEKTECSSQGAKRRRSSNSNETAPSVVNGLQYPPGVNAKNEKDISPAEEVDSAENSRSKNGEYSSIAVVHYPSMVQDPKRTQTEREKVKHEEEENSMDTGQDSQVENDFYTDPQSLTSDSTVTSDPSHTTDLGHSSKLETPTYVCSFCSKNFKYKSNLKKHCYEKHNIQHLYKCPYCEQFVVNRRLFKEHILTHEENRPFRCGICSRMFQTQSDLKRHLVTPNVHRNSLPRLMQQ